MYASNWVTLTTQGPPGPEGTISSDNVTIRSAEFGKGRTNAPITSEFGAVDCNADEVIIGVTCSADASSFDGATTNYGVLWYCDKKGVCSWPIDSCVLVSFKQVYTVSYRVFIVLVCHYLKVAT